MSRRTGDMLMQVQCTAFCFTSRDVVTFIRNLDNNNWRTMKRFMGFHSAFYLRAVTFGKFKHILLSSNEKAVKTSNLESSQIFEEHHRTSLSGMDPLHISMVQNFRHLTSWIFPCLGD